MSAGGDADDALVPPDDASNGENTDDEIPEDVDSVQLVPPDDASNGENTDDEIPQDDDDSVPLVPPPAAADDASNGENTDDEIPQDASDDDSVQLAPDEFATSRPLPLRKRRKPGDAEAAFRQMVFARRASEDARKALLEQSCISQTRHRVEPPYPDALVASRAVTAPRRATSASG